jgi:hypothetical protein
MFSVSRDEPNLTEYIVMYRLIKRLTLHETYNESVNRYNISEE